MMELWTSFHVVVDCLVSVDVEWQRQLNFEFHLKSNLFSLYWFLPVYVWLCTIYINGHTFSFLTSMFWRQHVFLGATSTLSWRPSIYLAEYDSMTLSLLSFYYCHKNNDNHGRQFSIDSPSMSVMPHKLWVVSFTHASSPFLQGLMDTEFHRAVQQKTTSAINSCPTCQWNIHVPEASTHFRSSS